MQAKTFSLSLSLLSFLIRIIIPTRRRAAASSHPPAAGEKPALAATFCKSAKVAAAASLIDKPKYPLNWPFALYAATRGFRFLSSVEMKAKSASDKRPSAQFKRVSRATPPLSLSCYGRYSRVRA